MQQHQNNSNTMDPDPSDYKPLVIAKATSPAISDMVAGLKVGTADSGGDGISTYPSESAEFSLKETRPRLAGESSKKKKTSSTYDIVEQMQYLYVRVVKTRNIAKFSGVELVAEVKLGNYSRITKTAALSNMEWNQLFAFSKEFTQSTTTVEIIVKDRNDEDHDIGRVWFDLSDVPCRIPMESDQLAPQWYRMEDKANDAKPGELMVSVWFGTQDDEAFAEAWHSEATNVPFDRLSFTKSKVYHSPKLWYLRVSVIEAEHIMPGHRGQDVVRFPQFFVRAQVGNQYQLTSTCPPHANRSFSSPYWQQNLFLVVEEPFQKSLLVSVEDQVGQWSNREVKHQNSGDVVVAMVELPLATIEKRADERPVTSRWFELKSHFGKVGSDKPSTRFVPRIHLRVSFDGGYHVLGENIEHSGDLRPSDTRLSKPHIGVLEMRILGASGLVPVKVKGGEERETHAYCIAMYGPKWFRTHTVVDSLSPEWNEVYHWEVYDPWTVVTVGVFDNSRIAENNTENDGGSDYPIGKVRIRLSTLETGRVYTQSYPLLSLTRSGVKKMGELHLCMRFSCSNVANMLLMYTIPLLPRMHYVEPLYVQQRNTFLDAQRIDILQYEAAYLSALTLSRAQPPLGRGVVEYMLETTNYKWGIEDNFFRPKEAYMWSMWGTKYNFFRLREAFSSLLLMGRFLKEIRYWQKPVNSALVLLIIFVTLVTLPTKFIIPTIFFIMAFMGIWCYRFRPRYSPQTDTRAFDRITPDDLDELFDTIPTTSHAAIVRMRYEKLRDWAGKIQTMAGNVADALERFHFLLRWRDPRATVLFLVLCLVAAAVSYFVPFRVVVALFVLYTLRPPWFRSKLPSAALCFFERSPTNVDIILW